MNKYKFNLKWLLAIFLALSALIGATSYDVFAVTEYKYYPADDDHDGWLNQPLPGTENWATVTTGDDCDVVDKTGDIICGFENYNHSDTWVLHRSFFGFDRTTAPGSYSSVYVGIYVSAFVKDWNPITYFRLYAFPVADDQVDAVDWDNADDNGWIEVSTGLFGSNIEPGWIYFDIDPANWSLIAPDGNNRVWLMLTCSADENSAIPTLPASGVNNGYYMTIKSYADAEKPVLVYSTSTLPGGQTPTPTPSGPSPISPGSFDDDMKSAASHLGLGGTGGGIAFILLINVLTFLFFCTDRHNKAKFFIGIAFIAIEWIYGIISSLIPLWIVIVAALVIAFGFWGFIRGKQNA